MTSIPTHNPRLLAIDGGGVRGLSSLLILKQLMETIDPDAEKPPKPCEYFDMIGGTSTGGLIAIMLGRLEMDVDSCIDAYLTLSDRVFQKKRQWMSMKGKAQGRFDSDELERAIKQILVEQGRDPEELLRIPGKPKCKVFVCATSRETNSIVRFRSYGGRGVSRPIRIWEAGRATSAAPSFFDPITIGAIGETFADGAMGANNPVFQLWSEALYEWPELETTVQCVVSVGTGVMSATPFKDDVFHIISSLAKIVTECDATAEKFLQDKRMLDTQKRYYRFNVEEGLGDVAMEDSKQKPFIAAATNKYVETHKVFKALEDCATMLRIPLRSDQYIKMCHQALVSSENLAQFEDVRVFNDGDWLFQHPVYRCWRDKTPDSESTAFLTLKGNPGAGKSVLMKEAVLDNALDPSVIVINHFCSQSHQPNQGQASPEYVTSICRSMLGQLILQVPKTQCISEVISTWGEDIERNPTAGCWLINRLTVGQLRENIIQVMRSNRTNVLGQPIRFRLYIDGINDCEGDHSECLPSGKGGCQLSVMTFLSQLLAEALPQQIDVGILMSRQYVPIFGDNEPRAIVIELDKHNKHSVQAFIVKQLRRLNDHDRELRLYLQLQAHVHDGFLWATLVTQEILGFSPSEGHSELAAVFDGIPRRLTNLYERALYNSEIARSSRIWDFFKVALGALRPMTSRQFRQAFAFADTFGHTSIEEWELSDTGFHPERFTNRLRRDSRGLLEIITVNTRCHMNGSNSEVRDQVRFIHRSVVNFLRRECDFTKLHPDFSTNMTEQCHLFLFKCCVNALDFYSLKKEHNVDFLNYACEFWAQHARGSGHLLDTLEDLPKFVLSCQARKTPRVLELQKKFLGSSQAKEFLLLESCQSDVSGGMVAVLATLGCGNLLRRHFKRCKDCKQSSFDLSYGMRGPYELAIRNSIIAGWTNVAAYLLEERCKGNLNVHLGGRTLMYTACYFRDLPVVEFLLHQKADACAWSRAKYEYPLHVAIALGATDLIKLLLGSNSVDKKAVLMARRRNGGGTALHFAVQSRQPQAKKLEVLRVIIKLAPHGANLLKLTDDEGKTPIGLARFDLGEDSQVVEELEDFEDEDASEDESGDESDTEGEHSDGEEA